MTTRTRLTRRATLGAAAAALVGASLLRRALAAGSVTAAIYPGSWDEAYRSHVAPALKAAHGVDLAMEPLFAVDQINKVQAARGIPPFDVFVLDPGPRIVGIDRGLHERFDPSRLFNVSKVPSRLVDE